MRTLFWLVLAVSAPVFPQGRDSQEESIRNWRMSKEFTIAVAELMPESGYSFKPDPEEMSFGVLMVHIAQSQAYRFGQVAGVKPPLERVEKADKAASIGQLRRSFDFCIEILSKLTAGQLDRMYKVDWYERPEVTGRQLILGMFTHTAHHRGQAEVYLRAKGIKPPAYRF